MRKKSLFGIMALLPMMCSSPLTVTATALQTRTGECNSGGIWVVAQWCRTRSQSGTLRVTPGPGSQGAT